MKDQCPHCYQPYDKQKRDAEAKRRKTQNAFNSQAKAKARGNKLGRKKVRDDELIKALRRQGLSIRTIAKQIGMSTAAVQNGLK